MKFKLYGNQEKKTDNRKAEERWVLDEEPVFSCLKGGTYVYV